MFLLILILNCIWFSMAFYTFSLNHRTFARAVIPRAHRDSPLFDILAESGRFLGGMNFAFALCNLLLIFNLDLFPTEAQRAFLLFIFAVAHASQFIFNAPIAIENTRGGGVWPVLKGVMLFIFVTDFLMMTLNLVGASLLML